MITKRVAIVLVSITLAVGVTACLLLNTRMGVHIVLDVLGGGGAPKLDYDPATGPLVLTNTLTPYREIELPTAIEQPSGIQHRGDKIYVATDQVELFVLSGDFERVLHRQDLIGGLLIQKQGKLESIERVGEQILLAGEFGAIWVWEETNGLLTRGNDIALPQIIREMEVSGLTQCGDRLLVVSDESRAILDVSAGETIGFDFGDHLKEDGDLDSMRYSGIASEDGKLYLLSESHSSIVVVDATDYSVKAVYGINPGPASDLAMRDGFAYVVVDHNYTEPKPPVYVYDLRQAQPAK